MEYQGEGCAIASGDGSVVAGGNSVALAVKREAYSSSNLHTATDRYSRCEFRVADSVGNVSAWHSVPYIKLDAAGNPLADQDISRSMSDEAWRCVQDVASNLIWEVKTDDGGLQDNIGCTAGITAIRLPTVVMPVQQMVAIVGQTVAAIQKICSGCKQYRIMRCNGLAYAHARGIVEFKSRGLPAH